MNKPSALQNQSSNPGNPEPSIKLVPTDPGWDEAITRWREGKPPTDSPEWKKGVYLVYDFSPPAKPLTPSEPSVETTGYPLLIVILTIIAVIILVWLYM